MTDQIKSTSTDKNCEPEKMASSSGGLRYSRMDAAHALLGVGITSSDSGNSGALDALAALASSAHSLEENGVGSCAMELDESPSRLPPQCPTYRRLRAVSNPEGMEKWDASRSLNAGGRGGRFSSDLDAFPEEEPMEAEDVEVDDRNQKKGDMSVTLSLIRALEERKCTGSAAPSISVISSDDDTASITSGVLSSQNEATSRNRSRASSISTNRSLSIGNAEEVDIVRRARSRLLEELETNSKGGPPVNLPHSYAKFKNIYNQEGRVGIYSPEERTAIIARFHDKRLRRVWNKKIRYNCRKNLADRRLRVKGRFVKRDSEEAKAYLAELEAAKTENTLSSSSNSDTSPVPPSTLNDMGPPPSVRIDGMPDVNDPEAGFCPTKDLPYRRARRHTIT